MRADEVEVNVKRQNRDVIVVGAGIAGILTAYYLKQEGKDVLLLEADRPLSGQTGRTTAKITSQHGLKYAKLIKKLGRKRAELYAQANEAAIREYEALVRERDIQCGFERVPAYLYSEVEDEQLKQEAEAAASLGIPAFFTTKVELPFEVAGAVCFPEQAQFDPTEFLQFLFRREEKLQGGRRRTVCPMTEFRLLEIIRFLHRISMWRPDFKNGE